MFIKIRNFIWQISPKKPLLTLFLSNKKYNTDHSILANIHHSSFFNGPQIWYTLIIVELECIYPFDTK